MAVANQNVGDPKERTPEYPTPEGGRADWSGKHVSELTALDLVALLQFCCEEAPRSGWRDASTGQTDVVAGNPFHVELLGGFPLREWASHYVQGIRDFTLARLQQGENGEMT